MDSRFIVIAFGTLLSVAGCVSEGEKNQTEAITTADQEHVDSGLTRGEPPSTLFTRLLPEDTGIQFSNTVAESPEFNHLSYPFMYNGGGVAIGDINKDGLPDILLTGNRVSSRLYLNKGEMKFEDITESAGMTTDRWISGASMVDINQDGYLDIYLSSVSQEGAPAHERANLLFINNGNNTFTERAEEFNIADTSHTTQAVFLDYNRNGLLDLFLLNHSPGSFSREMADSEIDPGRGSLSTGYDRLYRNNGDGTFTDVSEEAGILEVTGYGLGVVVADLNRDGWPDLYVSNDIGPNDVLYINNMDGTFTDKSADYLKHTSFAGMGIDIADFNNDGWPDILQVDMTPPDYKARKLMSYGISYENFNSRLGRGYHYSYSQNTLQMNNGVDANGNLVFSEVGRLAGVAYTDWSWAALFGDYNNSGLKDILITNGYPKAVNNYDYLVETVRAIRSGGEDKLQQRTRLLENLHDINVPNYLFRNEGNITFSDVSEEWGFLESGYSYGAAHADLNNDGTLDLVINNLNAPASIYQNNSRQLFDNHYLSVELAGTDSNKYGIGTNLIFTTGQEKQYVYHTPYRGYQSSMSQKIHVGLGTYSVVDSLEVFWPDGRRQLLRDVKADQHLKVFYEDATEHSEKPDLRSNEKQRFVEVTEEVGLIHEHQSYRYNDYQIQPLLHRQLSLMGPKITTGDVTGNELDDVFIGGSADHPGTLYIQGEDGKFEEFNQNQPWLSDQANEDMGSVFFDANGDGLLDLYVTSGGYMVSQAEETLLDRLYINGGEGKFYKADSALPNMYTSSSVVVPGDFNGDGQPDLYVGGRLTPLKYPFPAKSYILENQGGTFRDVTEKIAPELVEPGMITDALWVDFDEDGRLDLVTTGVWLPVQFYRNDGTMLRNVTHTVVDNPQRGWWYSLQKGDFNKNGSTDFAAGNLGLNDTFRTSEEKKFGVSANDFNKNFSTDIIFTVEENGVQYPYFGRAKFDPSLGALTEKYDTFESFSKATLDEIVPPEDLDRSIQYQADTFASMLFQNKGDGTFTASELPEQAQLSPINEMISVDVDQDGNMDLILAGNIFEIHPDVARSDAGNGLWMKGNGKGEFEPVSSFISGFFAPGNVKDIKMINTPGGKAVLVANNNGSLQVFRIESK